MSRRWHLNLSDSRRVCAGAFGGQRAGQLSRLWRFPLPLPNPAALPQEGEGQLQGGPGWGERQWRVRRWGGIGFWHLSWLRVEVFGLFFFNFFSVLGVLRWCTRKKKVEGYTSCMAGVCVRWSERRSYRLRSNSTLQERREGSKERETERFLCLFWRALIEMF